jgi:hypothetical protein
VNVAWLLRALQIIALNWYRQGCPSSVDKPLGKFESWHRTIAGMLKCAGIGNFLGNLEADLEADDTARPWEVLFSELREAFSGQEFLLRIYRAATASIMRAIRTDAH